MVSVKRELFTYLVAIGLCATGVWFAGQLLVQTGGRLAGAVRPEAAAHEVERSRFNFPPTPFLPPTVPWTFRQVQEASGEQNRAVPGRLFHSVKRLKVRAKPTDDSDLLGILHPTKSIVVVGEEGVWAKFFGPTGRASWVDKTYLVPVAR